MVLAVQCALPVGEGYPTFGKLLGEVVETDPTIRIGVKEFLYNGGLRRVKLEQSGIAWALGVSAIAVGGVGLGQQLAIAHFGLSPTTHAFGNECALVLGDGASDLQHELVMRIVTE